MGSTCGPSYSESETRHHSTRNQIQRIADYLKDQRAHVHGKMLVACALCAPLPKYVGAELRAAALRAAGFAIGCNSGFFGMPSIYGRGDYYRRLKVGCDCWINIGCHLELSAPVTIGDHVSFGPNVMILTGTHAIGPERRRAADFNALPVIIGEGVWLGAHCTIMPGVTVGNGSVVSAGAVVNRDVPPNTIITGTQGMPLEKWMALTRQVKP